MDPEQELEKLRQQQPENVVDPEDVNSEGVQQQVSKPDDFDNDNQMQADNNPPEPKEPVQQQVPNTEDEYEIALDVEDLPSNGVLYDFDRIWYRGLTVKQEQRLENTRTLLDSRDVLRELVQECTDQDIMQLTYGDLMSMYVWVRINTWNENYPAQFDCRYCSKQNRITYDLSTLNQEELDSDYSEPFKVWFNDGDTEVHLGQLRVADEKRAENFIRERGGKYDMDQGELYAKVCRALMIKQVSDVRDTITDKMQFIDELDNEEYAVIKKFSNDTTHGLTFRYDIECNECGREQERQLDFKPELLYPDPDDVVGDMSKFTEDPNGGS
jgi:hypothetical protein